MARLSKIRTPQLVEGGFSASRGGGHWFVGYPWGETHRVNISLNQKQMRLLLQFARAAYEAGVTHTRARIHEALGL
jgi:hypothetical protein